MRQFFISILLMTASILTAGASTIIEQADSAYMADDFAMAASLYNKVIAEEGTSATLYYNLGNCYYRLGQPGKAIVAYERSLRLDPTSADTRDNLDFVNERIIDRSGERGTFIGNALDAASNRAKSDTWAWLAFGFFVLTVSGVALYVFSSSVPLRKTGFFGGIVTLIGTGIFIFFAFRSAALSLADDAAVITAPSTILSTVPRIPHDRNQEAMLLHEGTKVKILDSVRTTTADSVTSTWYDVEIDNTHRAWIDSNAVEKI